MPSRDLIALLPGPPPQDLPAGLSAQALPGWTAILARPTLGQRLRRNRKALLRMAGKRQLWLESLMPSGPVLPALPGTRIATDALAAMILCNADLLSRLAARLEGRVQYQITLRCDLSEAIRALASRPGPFQGLECPELLQKALAEHVSTRLGHVPQAEIIALPVSADVVANCALLLPETAVPALDQALEEIDALWSAGFALRQIGPSPAVSFASLRLEPVSLAALKEAAACLQLDLGTGREAIRAARHQALKQPGAAQTPLRAAAQLLTMAGALDAPGPYHRVLVWAEGQAAPRIPAQSEAA
jgi:hypothetical protein